jgi:hypothetical protein
MPSGTKELHPCARVHIDRASRSSEREAWFLAASLLDLARPDLRSSGHFTLLRATQRTRP